MSRAGNTNINQFDFSHHTLSRIILTAYRKRIFNITPIQWPLAPVNFTSLSAQQVSDHHALVKRDNPCVSNDRDTPLVSALIQTTFSKFNIPDSLSFSEEHLFACDYIFSHVDSFNNTVDKQPPLRLVLYSPDDIRGVRVINEIVEGFHRRGVSHTLLTISSSKFRALLIRGFTITEATRNQLNNCDALRTITDDNMKYLRKMWRRVRYVILDDFSGFTKNVLALFSILLGLIKDIDLPFGGLNVILHGNFFQSHSIALRKSLYQGDTRGPSSLSQLGKYLYAGFQDVVILNRRPYADDMLKSFWTAVEDGVVYDIGRRAQDIDLFRHYRQIDFRTNGWDTAPLITNNIPLIRSWNNIALRQYASNNNQRVFCYNAIDTVDGHRLSKAEQLAVALQEDLNPERSNKDFYFCIGAPVILRYDLAPHRNLVKGLKGYITGVVLHRNEPDLGGNNIVRLKHTPVSILVKFPESIMIGLPGLPTDVIPISCVSTSPNFENLELMGLPIKRMIRKQFPLSLAFAMTVRQARNTTITQFMLDNISLDLSTVDSCAEFICLLARVPTIGRVYCLQDVDINIFSRNVAAIPLLIEERRLRHLSDYTYHAL